MPTVDTLSKIVILEGVFLVIATFIILVLWIRVRQLTNDLREMKKKMEITDEELYKLAEDIKEFKNLKLW